jgi:hypothetical protein
MCIGSDESNDASIRDLPKKGVINVVLKETGDYPRLSRYNVSSN